MNMSINPFRIDWEEYWFQNIIFYYNKYKNLVNLKYTEVWIYLSPIVSRELIKNHPEFPWNYSSVIDNIYYKNKFSSNIKIWDKIIKKENNEIQSIYVDILNNNLDLDKLKYIDLKIILKNLDKFIPLFIDKPEFTFYLSSNKTLTFEIIHMFPNHKWPIKNILVSINFSVIMEKFIEEFEEILAYVKNPKFNLVFHDGTGRIENTRDLFYYLYQNPTLTIEHLKKLEDYLNDNNIVFNSFYHRIYLERSVSFEIFDLLNDYLLQPNFNVYFNHILINDFELEKKKYIEMVKKERFKLIKYELYAIFLHPDNIIKYMNLNDDFKFNSINNFNMTQE